jgi:hypothetical protein
LTGTFKALIATEGASAASRFSATGANWVRLDGVAVAASPEDFLGGRWLAPLGVQPGGAHVDSPVWFGANDLVTPGTAASTCTSWTVLDTSLPAVGSSASAGPLAFRNDTLGDTCSGGGLLYCVEP